MLSPEALSWLLPSVDQTPADIAIQSVVGRIRSCRACKLCAIRAKVVPGIGNSVSRVFILGESPGRAENAQGIPFIGDAGKLLTKYLSVIGLPKEKLFITNTLKCMPEGGRDPQPDCMAACRHFTVEQLAIVSPWVVVTFGLHALRWFCVNYTIGEMHGVPFEFDQYLIYPMYHPAAILRNPALEEAFAYDFQILVEELELEAKA